MSMSEIRVVMPTEEELHEAIRERTLSEQYNLCSPTSKAIIKAFSQGVTPTSKPRLSEEFDVKKIYIQSDESERSTMAYYGMVSYEYHKKNKDVQQKRASITSSM
jgi:hypothetical protein